MFILDIWDQKLPHIYVHSVYELLHECARDMNLKEEMTDNKLDFMFGIHKDVFYHILSEWAMKKYNMFIRMNIKTGTIVSNIEIGWEDLTDEECELVFLQMYPQVLQ